MSENRSIEEAISRFVESLEEEQKNDKLLESNNTKEKYLENKVYDFEEQDEEKERR